MNLTNHTDKITRIRKRIPNFYRELAQNVSTREERQILLDPVNEEDRSHRVGTR